jgi:ribulose bisphosphate carboxylase small subunit
MAIPCDNLNVLTYNLDKKQKVMLLGMDNIRTAAAITITLYRPNTEVSLQSTKTSQGQSIANTSCAAP